MKRTETRGQAVASDFEREPEWYRDSIIYQLHVKAFFDASDDGVGDFKGLTSKLDYIQDLGVSAIWLLPFYPSPLRDDGYDVADYKNVHPPYGTLKDARQFIRECHRRGLHVITELVINHTSDQHPWFQKARRASKGSKARDFYVWADDDEGYPGTRIIFLDTEQSNWAWDPVAHQYYWHRFFSHQPDLNFDNPRVRAEVKKAMKFWLDAGVDGFRLDAIPYLVEREGTNNENLPETHGVLKELRAWLDEHYDHRLFLAEANQWPEDTRPYFGDGDECHMGFHFPLMPRLYMALAQEDRHPVTDILRQTPDLPEGCQWAIFLRNHDELTLEMVTERERDYLWNYYAHEERARINLGIRRRLAPLLNNDRRKIELLNSILMSMPGTPIVYYGDEIGMGDNIYLGDRDGVRTPMQWSADRNAGFSRADPARLYLPAIMDPVYGYEAVNVERQNRDPSSLLNWMRRLITVRRQHRAFGRGALRFLYPGNRKVIAYLRTFEGETLLCVANLSRAAQPAELDLAEFDGRVPVELLGRSAFPPIGELPYFITLPAYGFYWFVLAEEAEAPSWHERYVPPVPELPTLVVPDGWESLAGGDARSQLEQLAVPAFVPLQRWYAAKDRKIQSTELVAHAAVAPEGRSWLFARFDVRLEDGEVQRYQIPLSMAWETSDEDPLARLLPATLARVRRGPRIGVLYDAQAEEDFVRDVARSMGEQRREGAGDGELVFSSTSAFARALPSGSLAEVEVRRLGKEQSNTSSLLGSAGVLKLFRRVEAGTHPEIEIGRYLTEVAEYPNAPSLLGALEHVAADGTASALAVLQAYVPNQGDGWSWTVDYVKRLLEDVEHRRGAGTESDRAAERRHMLYLTEVTTLGRRTAELHRAFALPSGDPAFEPEPVTAEDLRTWRAQVLDMAETARRALAQSSESGEHDPEVVALLGDRERVAARVDALLPTGGAGLMKTRLHGDLHLGQVMKAQDDFYILDFEGEPQRPLAERRVKHCVLRDVAGMLRSFDYAAWASLFASAAVRPDGLQTLIPWAEQWRRPATAAFLDGYVGALEGCPSVPSDAKARDDLIALFTLEKALYEVAYEAANRPTWVRIPLEGIRRILAPSP
ncbi:MAG: maltose alpha-D-glucosyltransferase [Deltaproteobacteria bacterium]|nr:maltose alpha-D-glucosyltransferase [Deltaproteobacteria bacterium]